MTEFTVTGSVYIIVSWLIKLLVNSQCSYEMYRNLIYETL